MKSWGLVLSGGAAYGMANIGVLEVLERNSLRPNCISGSSMGAIVAGLYAMGVSVERMTSVTEDLKMLNIARFSEHPLRHGLHGGILRQNITDRLSPLVGDARIGDCTMPFICMAGRVREPIKWQKILKEGFVAHAIECIEPYVFPDDTPLIDALLASSAIPVIFSPVRVGEDDFIDLCHFGSVPARTLRSLHQPESVIATCTNPRMDLLERLLPKSWQSFITDGLKELQLSLESCDLVIEPEMVEMPFRFDKGSAFIESGKKATEARLEELKNLLR